MASRKFIQELFMDVHFFKVCKTKISVIWQARIEPSNAYQHIDHFIISGTAGVHALLLNFLKQPFYMYITRCLKKLQCWHCLFLSLYSIKSKNQSNFWKRPWNSMLFRVNQISYWAFLAWSMWKIVGAIIIIFLLFCKIVKYPKNSTNYFGYNSG